MTHVTFLPLKHPHFPREGPHAGRRRRRRDAVVDADHYAELWQEFLRQVEEAETGWEDLSWAR